MSETPALVLHAALEKALPGKIFYPGSETYNAFQTSFFVAQQRQLLPECIVRPTSSQDVASFIKTYLDSSVDRSASQLAIRGGGHSTVVGSSNTDGGITLDMGAMRDVELPANSEIVYVEAGAVWGDVYSKMDPLKLSVAGGHNYDVGVAGFTLGENFEVILASGDIVNANAKNNTDLWQALKGGLSNLGIVTRFDFRLFPQAKIWGGYIVTPMTALNDNLAALVGLGENWDPRVAVEQSFTFSADRGLSIVNNMEFRDDVEEPNALAPFASIKPTYGNTMRLASLSEIAKENQQLQSVGIRQTFCTTSFYLDLEHLKAVCDIFQGLLPSVKEINGMRWTLTYRHLHNDMPLKAAAAGGNCTGLGSPMGSLIVCVLTYSWTDASVDEQMNISLQKFIHDVDMLSKKAGFFYSYKYPKYAAAFQDPVEGFAAGTNELLQSASRKYDPEGVFQKLVPGGFKLQK